MKGHTAQWNTSPSFSFPVRLVQLKPMSVMFWVGNGVMVVVVLVVVVVVVVVVVIVLIVVVAPGVVIIRLLSGVLLRL